MAEHRRSGHKHCRQSPRLKYSPPVKLIVSSSFSLVLNFCSCRHYPTFSSLIVITQLDRVIPLPSPIFRMSRSSRSLTRWNNNYPLSLSSCHYLTSSLSLSLSPTFSSLSVITRLDRVIPLSSPPILRMLRSSRSMTGRNDNYSTFLLFLPLPDIFSLPAVIPRRSPLLVITRLDRVIPLLPSQPILRMPRASRSMTE